MIISQLCKTGDHEWCANRTSEECHCECPCHTQKAEAARQKRLEPVVAMLEKNIAMMQEFVRRASEEEERLSEQRPTPWDQISEAEGELRAYQVGLAQFRIALRQAQELDLPGWIGS